MDPIAQLAMPMPPRMPSSPSLPLPGANATQIPKRDASRERQYTAQETIDIAAAERARHEMVERAAQQIANIYVVSDHRFTIFKDASGQYITRFTSLRDGKVTYIPEPDLLQFARRSFANEVPLVQMQV